MTLNRSKSTGQVLTENFFATFVVLLALMNTSRSFYLFTLTGKVFQKELKLLFLSHRRQVNIEPTMAIQTIIQRSPPERKGNTFQTQP